MPKTLIGPQLRQLRRERGQTQAQMAQALGVSTAYVNLLENNQRSLSVKMLMALSAAYGVDWRELMKDDSANKLASLRAITRDPVFGQDPPDIQELRAAIDHAPRLVEQFMSLYRSHRTAIEKMMRVGSGQMAGDLLSASPEGLIHDFFRDHSNYFHDLEKAAEDLREAEPSVPTTSTTCSRCAWPSGMTPRWKCCPSPTCATPCATTTRTAEPSIFPRCWTTRTAPSSLPTSFA